jgi:tRNA(adenine34) deaminase
LDFVVHAALFRPRPRPRCRARPLVLSPNVAGSQGKTLGEQPKGQGRLGSVELVGENKDDPMSLAFAEACSAELRGEAPIGAALVREGTVIATAGNRTRELSDPTAHAEMIVIREAAAKIGSERLIGFDLYVTLEPCVMCAGAISFARLRRLYYAAPDPKGGAVDHGPRFFREPTCHHAPEVYGGLREREAAEMLRAFFAARR